MTELADPTARAVYRNLAQLHAAEPLQAQVWALMAEGRDAEAARVLQRLPAGTVRLLHREAWVALETLTAIHTSAPLPDRETGRQLEATATWLLWWLERAEGVAETDPKKESDGGA